MTTIYLAYARVPESKRADFNAASGSPAILLSYFYLPGIFKTVVPLNRRSWCLDSGAYSAHTRGRPIKNDDFMRFILDDLPRSPIGPPEMIFGLDVIGDWKAGLKNCEEAWARGIQAVPTWHHGEPFDVLKGIAKDYPKIAIGGMARGTPKAKAALMEKCFHLIWPKLVHGFGVTDDRVLDVTPFDTVDSTTWSNPLRYGYYPKSSGGGARFRTTYGNASLRPEVEFYLRKERDLSSRWNRVLAPLRDAYRKTLVPTPYQAIPTIV